MLFNTTQFFLFLAAVLALFYSSPRRFRRYILLAASYFFYACWNPKFIALLLTLTAIDYTAAIWLEKVAPGPRKKALLILSLSANLGFLGFFKYYNFLAGNLALLLGRPSHWFWLDIVLPLGISFHTFQSMSYVVDVYRGEQKAVRIQILLQKLDIGIYGTKFKVFGEDILRRSLVCIVLRQHFSNKTLKSLYLFLYGGRV